MADSKLSMLYNLRQMNNSANKSNLLWFPKCYRKDTLNMRGMAAHIADHGSPYTRDTVLGVLTAFRDCLVEIVSQGNGVKLDGLGTFYPTLESKGAESPVGYNINEYLRGVHIRFLPESAAEDDITSRVLKKAVVFKQNMIFDRNVSAQEGGGWKARGLHRRARRRQQRRQRRQQRQHPGRHSALNPAKRFAPCLQVLRKSSSSCYSSWPPPSRLPSPHWVQRRA